MLRAGGRYHDASGLQKLVVFLPMNVVFSVSGEVIVDDEGDLLDVDASGQQVGGDEDSGRARAELAHDDVTFLLVHVAVLQNKTKPEQ